MPTVEDISELINPIEWVEIYENDPDTCQVAKIDEGDWACLWPRYQYRWVACIGWDHAGLAVFIDKKAD